MKLHAISLLCLLSAPVAGSAAAAEIATGSMLGPRYKADRFYVRASRGDWAETYSAGHYKRTARGKLMMLRVSQGLFDDEWLTERKFDPDANTDALIAALDDYKSHGVLAIGVSLQGGDPGYSQEANGISRKGPANDGEKLGRLVSAFKSDGTLKPPWLARTKKLLKAADQRGMVVCLTYFDPAQDEALANPRAIVAAVRNMTRWLVEQDFRNVVIEVANAWDLEGDTWDHRRFVPRNIANLVMEAREEFNGAAFTLPIGASTGGSLSYPNSLARVCDLVLLQGGGRSAGDKAKGVAQLSSYERAVWLVEDRNGDGVSEASLAQERASADALFREGAGWSYTPWPQTLRFPFRYDPGESSVLDGSDDREGAYFRAVLEHVAGLVMKKPPTTLAKR